MVNYLGTSLKECYWSFSVHCAPSHLTLPALRKYPLLQAHWWLPFVFIQRCWQPPLLLWHSSMSARERQETKWFFSSAPNVLAWLREALDLTYSIEPCFPSFVCLLLLLLFFDWYFYRIVVIVMTSRKSSPTCLLSRDPRDLKNGLCPHTNELRLCCWLQEPGWNVLSRRLLSRASQVVGLIRRAGQASLITWRFFSRVGRSTGSQYRDNNIGLI